MKSIIVIADDLTGAAEIAGVGLRYGLATRLVVDRTTLDHPDSQLTVVNADTRWLPESEARRVVTNLVGRLSADAILFKKIDSVVRGHVAPEIDAILDATARYDHVLLVPQNPSRRRIVLTDGTYLVEGTPLAKTTFADDPDHPARTSNIMDRLVRSSRPASLRVDARQPLLAGMVNVGVAETFETVQDWMKHRTSTTLIVGAADLFRALLIAEGFALASGVPAVDLSGRHLYLCGSTATASRRALRQFASAAKVEVLPPDADRACASIRQAGLAVVMSPEPGGVEAEPRDVEDSLAACAATVIARADCDWLFAEGGATASAVCRTMRWTSLEVDSELASGVVVLRPSAVLRLAIKPGSYAWPASVLQVDRPSH